MTPDLSVGPLAARPAPESPEKVRAGPTRRAVLNAAGGIGLAAFLASCDVGRPTSMTTAVPDAPGTTTPPAVGTNRAVPYVRITTTGTTFSPTVELAAGSTATVSWVAESGAGERSEGESGAVLGEAAQGAATASGTEPTMTFATPWVHHVRMSVEDGGVDALGEVTTFNLGFDHRDDAGIYNMGAGYDKAGQSVTSVENVSRLTGLLRFAAAHTPLAGSLDFTGCSRLLYIECIDSDVESVNVSGCTSLIRLVVEQTNLTTLDLNPVAANLRDLRAAAQQGGTLTVTPLTAPLAALYHFCVRDQTLVNHPTPAQLPVVEEQWTWNTGQSGELTSASNAIRSLVVYGNRYATADLTDQFPAGRHGTLEALNNNLTAINLNGCSGLHSIDLSNNRLSTAAVDSVLAVVTSWGTSGGSLNLAANSAPSSNGMASGGTLTARGWTVTTAT